MRQVFGMFIFRNEGNGCLTSIFLEHSDNTSYSECSKKQDGQNVTVFEGNYRTVWLEATISRQANLNISAPVNGVYHLHWTDITDFVGEYHGTAVLSEGNLTGTYWLQQ